MRIGSLLKIFPFSYGLIPHQAIMDACLDDSTKIIRYMEEKEKQSRPYNLTMLILALISAIGGTVAAITGVMTYLSQLS